jgi:hypothetical protein
MEKWNNKLYSNRQTVCGIYRLFGMFKTEILKYSKLNSDILANRIGYYSLRISFIAIRKEEWKTGEGLQLNLNNQNIPINAIISIPFEGDCGK